MACLRGHATAVTELAFTADDRMLLSSGLGGAVWVGRAGLARGALGVPPAGVAPGPVTEAVDQGQRQEP